MAVSWARVNQAAVADDGRLVAVARGRGHVAELLVADGAGQPVERLPVEPPLPEAAAAAARVRRSRVGGRLLVASPATLGVVTLPPAGGLQTTLSQPPAR